MPTIPTTTTTPDTINVRVTLDSYDVAHPSEKQCQVYVQIPGVASAAWLLDADLYEQLRDEPWPHVIDSAHMEYALDEVSDPESAAARQAIAAWLLRSEGAEHDARYDSVYQAWEADQARRHPVARKLLAENKRLRAEAAKRAPRAEALPADDLRERIVHALRTTRVPHTPRSLPFPSHHQPGGETGGFGWCALCDRDSEALADAVLAVLSTA